MSPKTVGFPWNCYGLLRRHGPWRGPRPALPVRTNPNPAGAGLLLVLIASMFEESMHVGTIFGTALLLVNALVVLRVSIHPRIRDLTRQQALWIGAVLHLAAFGVMTLGASQVDAVMVIVFGAIPAALLFLAAFAMQHRAKSSAPAARGYASPPA